MHHSNHGLPRQRKVQFSNKKLFAEHTE